VGLIVVIAVTVAIASSGSSHRTITVVTRRSAPARSVGAGTGRRRIAAARRPANGRASAQAGARRRRHLSSGVALSGGTGPSAGSGLSLPKAIGQMIVSGFAGTEASPSILQAVEQGEVGGVILMGWNTAGGLAQTAALTAQLQAAARRGGNPGLLIMTDQEGGEVRRLPGPPDYAAAQMSDPSVAEAQGAATAQLLHEAGVNVDLAPVADVARVDGFMAQEQRTFGTSPEQVADAACGFALALANGGIAYTLKHFPGLGSAITSTDSGPVAVTEPANLINADDLAYRACGRGPLALVMVSSASYTNLTGTTPAVMSPYIYDTLMPADGIDAVTISDDFDAPAIAGLQAPAEQAINAGLDMVLYAGTEASASSSYHQLLEDAQQGGLSARRVQAAASAVLALKRALDLS
jgi:beta-N-acetylhexosaminidase